MDTFGRVGRVGRVPRSSRTRSALLSSVVLLVFAMPGFPAFGAAPEFEYRDGLRAQQGEHELRLDLISRYRFEYWHAPQSDDSNDIHGIRTRVGLRYSWRDALSL
jgi:hypothetical protein